MSFLTSRPFSCRQLVPGTVNGIFCPNENSTIGITKALQAIGKAGG